jgi:integrase/recombinase XerD
MTEASPIKFQEARDAFLDSIAASKEPTRQTYAGALAAFAHYLDAQRADGLDVNSPLSSYPENILLNFFLWLDKQGYSPFTLRTYLAAARRFLLFHYAERNLGEFDVVRSQEMLKGKLKLNYPQVKAPDALPALVTFYDQQPLPSADTPAGRRKRLCLLRDRAIVHALYATAGRVSEVAFLTRQEVAEGEADEVLITGKGGKDRWLYFTGEAQVAIRAYLAERDDNEAGLFISHGRDKGARLSRTGMWRVVKQAARALGMKGVSPHTFRHWRATQMLNDGVPLEVIQELLGHSDIGTTRKVYARSKRAKVKQAFRKHTPSPRQALLNDSDNGKMQ